MQTSYLQSHFQGFEPKLNELTLVTCSKNSISIVSNSFSSKNKRLRELRANKGSCNKNSTIIFLSHIKPKTFSKYCFLDLSHF